MSVNKKVWIYDLEQFKNFFCATFMSRDDIQEVHVFIIHSSRNDAMKLYRFLQNDVAGLIGFNCINYDYPLIHFFMAVMNGYGIDSFPNAEMITMLLKEESDRIINEEYPAIPEYQTLIPQLDLFRIHHFDNKSKITSLKGVEIAINFENVMDMPLEPDDEVFDIDISDILVYNLNDVRATREFYLLTVDMIEMRKKLGNKYNLNLRNYNDPKIGQEIFGRQIAKRKGWQFKYLKEMRTYRHSIDLGDCILPYIEFKSQEFNALLKDLKETEIITTYKAFEKSVIYKGFKYDYGTGGIHGCIEPGIYKAGDGYYIEDIDVKSFYPNLAITNNFYPQHLGEDFVHIYKELFDQRVEAQKIKDNATNSGLKLALNGAYGKSNDKYSLFYDPKYTMQITINGQLLLTMLIEDIVDSIPNAILLQINTDGVTVKLPETEREMLKMICESWQQRTKLILEYKEYTTMIIRDVNNYMAIDTYGDPKYKGCFEIIPMQNGAIAYNKDWSMRVVPKAIDAYYRFGTPIEDFIREHKNIYDFCLSFRARKDWNLYRVYINQTDKKREKLQKTIRYYISKDGDTLIKENKENGSIIQLESGHSSVLFNSYKKREWNDYEVDYNYYISEANKIKNAVYDGQLKLF